MKNLAQIIQKSSKNLVRNVLLSSTLLFPSLMNNLYSQDAPSGTDIISALGRIAPFIPIPGADKAARAAQLGLQGAGAVADNMNARENAERSASQQNVTIQQPQYVPQQYPQQQTQYIAPEQKERLEFFTFTKFVDINGNGRMEGDTELFGVGRDTVNFEKDQFGISIRNNQGRSIGKLYTLRAFTQEGELVAEVKCRSSPEKGEVSGVFITQENKIFNPFKQLPAGDYRITATLEETKQTLALPLRIQK